jgi:hypothetical protein
MGREKKKYTGLPVRLQTASSISTTASSPRRLGSIVLSSRGSSDGLFKAVVIAMAFEVVVRGGLGLQVLAQARQNGLLKFAYALFVRAVFRPDGDVRLVQPGRIGQAENVIVFYNICSRESVSVYF